MATPLFILGRQRSGTTWLGNQLSLHSQIAAVVDPDHTGILESAYFSHLAGRYGDLEHKSSFVELAEVLAASHYCRCAGIGIDFLYGLWPNTYEGVFRALMDEVARRKGARYWMEKSPWHSMQIEELAGIYPDARFVFVSRDPVDVAASVIYRDPDRNPDLVRPGSARRQAVRRAAGGTVVLRRLAARFAGHAPDRILLVAYEGMKANLEEVMRRTSAFLGLDFEPATLEQAYRPNTSFRGVKREAALTEAEVRIARFHARLASILPLSLLAGLQRRQFERNRGGRLPFWFFKSLPFVRGGEARASTDESQGAG